MPRVKIGTLGHPPGRVIIGKLSNPCLDYAEYMASRHPGEISAADLTDMRSTYKNMPDPDVAQECLLQLKQRQRADARQIRS